MRKAAEATYNIERFLEKYNGRIFDEEAIGGTVLKYFHAGNPLAIVGYAVYIEETTESSTS